MEIQHYKSINDKEYKLIHQWMRRNYGNAKKCENKNCPLRSKVFHYALIHGKKYERKIENYKMLCTICHFHYDNRKTIGVLHPMWGKKHSKKTRLKMKKSHKGQISPMKGKKHSKETKLKMSLTRKGRRHSKIAILHMKIAQRKRFNLHE